MNIAIEPWSFERWDDLSGDEDQFMVNFFGCTVASFRVKKTDWDSDEILDRFVRALFAPAEKVMNCE